MVSERAISSNLNFFIIPFGPTCVCCMCVCMNCIRNTLHEQHISDVCVYVCVVWHWHRIVVGGVATTSWQKDLSRQHTNYFIHLSHRSNSTWSIHIWTLNTIEYRIHPQSPSHSLAHIFVNTYTHTHMPNMHFILFCCCCYCSFHVFLFPLQKCRIHLPQFMLLIHSCTNHFSFKFFKWNCIWK